MLARFSYHLHVHQHQHHWSYVTSRFLLILMTGFEMGGLTDILTVILIPLYLCILRPFIQRYIPGMLKHIGLGMTIHLLPLLSV